MKIRAIKLCSVLLSLVFLCSCSDNIKVTKTKEITNKITQQSVILETSITTNEDYSDYFKLFKESFIVPGLYEGFIPQGFCYDPSSDKYIVSGYYEDSKFPSMIMIVNAKDNKLIAAHPLKNTLGEDYFGHAGGIAISETTVFITSGSTCYTFPTEKLHNTANGEHIQFDGKFKTNTLGSFACINNNTLWIGDFIQSSKKAREKVSQITTIDSGETFYAYCEGYKLVDGLPSTDKINSDSTGYIPDYMMAIPEQVQGMAITKTNKIIFSTSYGRKNNSLIYIFDDIFTQNKAGTTLIDGQTIELYACSSDLIDQKIIAPPMAEGLATNSGDVYIIFESGAAKYRNDGGKYPVENAYYISIE